MSREHFSPKTIERLRTRVAGRCSNPDCRIPTVAAGSDAMSVTLIGEAAHVRAASLGGPRYCESMTPKERHSIGNGIWLCSNCHKKVDRDEGQYTEQLLRGWKESAENQARKELGQPLPNESDASTLLVTALTGAPKHLARTAIANVHGAVEQHLQALDPRFIVETSYQDKVLRHTLKAKETVAISLRVGLEPADSVFAQLSGMFDHGVPLTVPAKDVTVTGSKLISHVFDLTPGESGHLTFTPHARDAVLRLVLTNPVTSQIESFDDMHGTITSGRKSLTFNGRSCGNTMQISFRKVFDGADTVTNAQFGADLEPWDGVDVRRLPFFEKLLRFFDLLTNNWRLEFTLEIEGKELLRGKLSDRSSASSYFASTLNLLRYTDRARSLCRHLNKTIRFSVKSFFPREDHIKLIEALDTFDLKRTYSNSDATCRPSCTVIVDDDLSNLRALQTANYSEMRMLQDGGDSVSVFGQTIDLPPLEIVFSSVKPIVRGDIANLKGGDETKVEFELADDCEYSYRFVRPS